MAVTAVAVLNGPINVLATSGSPIFTCWYALASRLVSSLAMVWWAMMRRVLVQRCPAVPTAPKRMARVAKSRSASAAASGLNGMPA